MPTPIAPPAAASPAAAMDAWLTALAVAQPGVSASGVESAPPSAPAPTPATAPAATPSSTAQPVLPGMPRDAASNPTGTATTSAPGGLPPGAAPGGGGGAQPKGPDFTFILILIGLMFVVMIFTSSRQSKREKKKRDELMASIRRNDKVQTIGGMIGTVVELRDDEVVIQGENPGSKFRFARSAIQQVLRSSGSPDGPATPEVEVKSGKEGSKV